MRDSILIFIGLLAIILGQSCTNAKASTKVLGSSIDKSDNGWTLVWNDEFDVDGLPNADAWDYDLADGCPHVCGWGNNELQYYTKDNPNNARVVDGHLIIEARKEKMGTKEYTSSRLVTRGKNSWKHGKIEIRAKLPTGLGTWPALWMMSEENKYGGWPRSGEIDIMEHVGYMPDSIIGTVHTEAFNHMNGTQVDSRIYMPDAEDEFYNYSIVWDEDKIAWYINDNQYHQFDNRHKSYKEWPFDQPFHLIMNIAVGGNWGGKHGVDSTVFPQQMLVDYVRVYQKKESFSNTNTKDK